MSTDAKTKGLFLKKNFKNFMASLLKNWDVLIKKYKKWKPNEKLSINVNTLIGEGGTYILMSTSEIGYLTLCYLCMTWLNWSLKVYSRLRTIPHLIHTQHTCLMFNKYLIHLLDCTCLNVMCVRSIIYCSTQKDFWSFYMFLEVIFITLCVHV